MTGRQPKDALLEMLSQPLSSSGLDLEDVEVSNAGRRRLVRVLVDKDGGATLDDIEAATQLIGGLLDDADTLNDDPYTLEVTSPGVGRPLTQPRHWRRNVHRLVQVQTHHSDGFTGRIIDADDAGATLDVDGTQRDLAYDDVATARVEIEFNRRRPGERAKPEKE